MVSEGEKKSMEHQSLWPDHTQAVNSQARSVEEHSLLSVPPQEHSILTIERHLSKSITRLAFCLGFLGSLVLIFMGVLLYDSFFTAKGGFHVVTPDADTLLLPLSFISMGVLSILRWKVHLLSKLLSAAQRQETLSQEGFGWLLFLSPFGIMGLFFIFAGVEMTWWHFPPLAVILAVGALSFLGSALFFSPPRSHTTRSSREKSSL
jgi:hypothetical protein